MKLACSSMFCVFPHLVHYSGCFLQELLFPRLALQPSFMSSSTSSISSPQDVLKTLSQGESLSHSFSFFSHSHSSVFIYILLRFTYLRFTYFKIKIRVLQREKQRVRNLPSAGTLPRWPQQVSWAKAEVQCQQLLQGPPHWAGDWTIDP